MPNALAHALVHNAVKDKIDAASIEILCALLAMVLPSCRGEGKEKTTMDAHIVGIVGMNMAISLFTCL